MMTEVFAPKITEVERIAVIHMERNNMTPWQYLEDWNMSGLEQLTRPEIIATRMKTKWPGNYRIVLKEAMPYKGYRMTKLAIEFDDPAEETMFRLRWA